MEILSNSFRPLSGSYISQFYLLSLENTKLVSVPYRGATFLLCRRCDRFVSVPYRGATFLNNAIDTEDKLVIVSVPYRGATFLNNKKQDKRKGLYRGFRPLSGSYISQLRVSFPHVHFQSVVSVPYRGATFLNTDDDFCSND